MRLNRTCLAGLALIVAGVAAGCGGGGSERAASARPQMPMPAEPEKVQVKTVGAHGGRFVIGQTNAPKTFNPLMANETSSTDVTQRLFIGLTRFDNETQKIEPELAKSWSVADDKLTWTFNLRRGAAFSDGKPITSADVLFSFQVAYDKNVHPSVQDLLIMNGKPWEVTAPDEYTIVIKTPEPNAMLIPLASSVTIVPKHILEGPFKAGTFASTYNVSTPPDQIVTSGAWKVQQYVPGEKTVIAPNPYWYTFDQANNRLPYLNEVVFIIVPDQDAADLKFRAGELDGLDNVKPENYSWYEQNQAKGNFTLHDLGPDLNTNYFTFNLTPVRKATPGKTLGEPYVGSVKY